MSLAAERTYLAYVVRPWRCSRPASPWSGSSPTPGHLALRRVTGVVLVVVGLLVAVTARSRWRQIDTAMRTGAPLPRSRASCSGGRGHRRRGRSRSCSSS